MLAASAQSGSVNVDFSGIPGSSVVGAGVVHPALFIHESAGNDVVALKALESPVAYGAQLNGVLNIANAWLPPTGGFADLGSGTYAYDTKKHQYVFTFAPDTTVSEFSVRMLDWGDFLPFGAAINGRCSFDMTAYNAQGDVVATDSIAFSSTGSQISHRQSTEFGDLFVSGDASTALGNPGNYRFRVAGAGITRVELHPHDRPSTDPHIAFADLSFTIESLPVAIDIKPGAYPNVLNRKSQGKVPVAVLGSAAFDAATILPETVQLSGVPAVKNPKGKVQASLEDVNRDGRADLVVHFDIQSLPDAATTLTLTGKTAAGRLIAGADTVVYVR